MAGKSDFEVSSYGELQRYHGNEEHVVIPDGVRTVKKGAFSGNDHIRTVDLNEASCLEPTAFEGCGELEAVIVHDYLQDIGTRAFAGCHSLMSVGCAHDEEWPDTLFLGDEAFAECTSLESVDLYDVSFWLEVADRCFRGCAALTSVVLGEALARLGDDVFGGCTTLERISLPMALRSQTPDEAEHHERVLQAIRNSCPNLQVLERRQLVKVWVEDENHELWEEEGDQPPWTTETFKHNVRRLACREHASQLAGRDTAGLFLGYSSLERLDLTGLDTSGATDLRQMFLGCRSLRSLDLSVLDTALVESMAHLTHNCHALESINLADIDLSRVRSLWSAFDSCESLVEIDLTGLRMPLLEKVGYMFRGCSGLRRANFRDVDLSQVKSLSHLFYGCRQLREADLTGTDLHSTTVLISAFEGCESLARLDLSGLKGAYVRKMDRCFWGCSSLTELDLSGTTFDIRYADHVMGWFEGCSSLRTLKLPEVRINRSRTSFHRLFDGCNSLERWEAPASWPVDRPGAIPEPTSECGMWWSVRSHRWMTVKQISRRGPIADTYTSDSDGYGPLVKLENGQGETGNALELRGAHAGATIPYEEGMFAELDAVSVDLTGLDVSQAQSLSHMFEDCRRLRSIDLSGLDTSQVTDLSYMFAGCTSLESVFFGDIDLSQVTDLSHMFKGCTSLKDVSLSGLDLSHVVTLASMFARCTSLRSVSFVDLSLPQATDFSYMYYGCEELRTVDFTGFVPAWKANMSHMFTFCRNLEGLTGFDPTNVGNLSSFLYGCKELHSFSLADFELNALYEIASMFGSCSSLVEVDLSNLSIPRVTNLYELFLNCGMLQSVKLDGLSAPSVRRLDRVFCCCGSLIRLDFSSCTLGPLERMCELFFGCGRLREVDLSGLDLRSVTNMTSAFEGCASLTELDLSRLKGASVWEMYHCFMGCSSLTKIDLSDITVHIYQEGYVLYRNKDLDSWFRECRSLKALRLPEAVGRRQRVYFHQLFDGCDSLERWEAPESWPISDSGAIPKPTAKCSMWWSERDQRWMTVEEVRRRGPMADTYTSEPQGKGR